MANGRTKVLIIGGGFGGLFCARRLGRVDVDVTLLDRAACHVFQPLLYQCATGTLSIGQISRSLREELARHRNVTTLLGEAIDLDADARRVTARRPDETTFTLDYDLLVIAAGMRQSYFGNEEFAAWAPGMKTLDDALSIRRRLFAAFEIAETLPPGPDRDAWLTFAVAGGGPTGVELAGPDPRNGDPRPGQRVPQHRTRGRTGAAVRRRRPRAQAASHRPHRQGHRDPRTDLGVELHMGVHVTDVRRDGVTVTPKAGGPAEDYAARTVLWTAGVEAVPFARHAAEVLGAKTDRAGRIAVERRPVGARPSRGVRHRRPRRPRQPAGRRRERHAGRTARRRLHPARSRRQAPQAYRYRDLGSAAYISRGHALLQAGPVKLSGFIGWLGWGFIHIAFLTGVRNRFSTVATWLATIARARRTDRTFALGSTTSPEHPYTWLKFAHPNMLDAKHDSHGTTPTP